MQPKQKQANLLGTAPVGALLRKFAIPSIVAMLVGALYNIVDQIFIANASYLGSYGNAANTVVFPLTVVALAIAVIPHLPLHDYSCLYQQSLLYFPPGHGKGCGIYCTVHDS